MSNNWGQPPSGYQPGENNNKAPHTGGLLRDYNQQQPRSANQTIFSYKCANAASQSHCPAGQLQPGQGNAGQMPAPGPSGTNPGITLVGQKAGSAW